MSDAFDGLSEIHSHQEKYSIIGYLHAINDASLVAFSPPPYL